MINDPWTDCARRQLWAEGIDWRALVLDVRSSFLTEGYEGPARAAVTGWLERITSPRLTAGTNFWNGVLVSSGEADRVPYVEAWLQCRDTPPT